MVNFVNNFAKSESPEVHALNFKGQSINFKTNNEISKRLRYVNIYLLLGLFMKWMFGRLHRLTA